MWWLSISETDSSVSSIKEKYRIASMFIITRAVSTPRDVERRESGSMFCETIEIISWSSYESSRKHENIALKSTVTEQWSSLIQQHIFAVHILILRCLTGPHMTVVSKSNYHVRLNVNMDIAHSISFYFNFGKGYHFALRLKQHFFDKARFF